MSLFSLGIFNLMWQWLKTIPKVKVDLWPFSQAAHIGVPSIYLNIVFSETIGPIELKFHMKTPYKKLAKIQTNC